MTNTPDFKSASIIEPQTLTKWSDSSIDVNLNIGRLDPSKALYLFIFDKNGVSNSVGFELGSAPTEPDPAPRAPTGLQVI